MFMGRKTEIKKKPKVIKPEKGIETRGTPDNDFFIAGLGGSAAGPDSARCSRHQTKVSEP